MGELLPVLAHLQGSCAPWTVAVHELSTDVFTLIMVMVPDVCSYSFNSAYTNAIASFAPNFAAKAAVAFSPLKTLTPQTWRTSITEGTAARKDKHNSDVTFGLYERRRRVQMTSERLMMQLPAIKGMGQLQRTRLRRLTSCHETP